MSCRICQITNKNLRADIELLLSDNDGTISDKNKADLVDKYADFKDVINAISNQDCEMHWNFHQGCTREPNCYIPDKEGKEQVSSVAGDINKDEANLLSELANKQMATFTVLDNKVKKALENIDDLTQVVINPTTAQFYREIGESLRATVRDIRDLNVSLNGDKNSAADGLKALAAAILGSKQPEAPTEDNKPKDLTTKEFDGK